MSETLLERCAFLAASAAGNPTHYVVEQALEHAELDWRFLSFEVDEAHFTKAFEGLDVLGFRGVLLAPGILRHRLYRNWAGASAQSPRALVPELVLLLVYAVAMTSELWPARPPGMFLVSLLAGAGFLGARLHRRSRERRQAG